MTKTHDLTVVFKNADELRLDPQNARTHGRKNLEAIKGSLKEFGQRRPLIVMPDLTVVAGNGTLEAMRELGWNEIAVTIVPGDWTIDRAKAYALADNRTAELASWDSDILLQSLSELEASGWAINDFGFEPGAFDDASSVLEDDVPEISDEATVTATGELWKLGKNRLLVGDATDQSDVKRLMSGTQTACVFTDPPYNVDYQGGTADKLTIMNDALPLEEFGKFIGSAYQRMFDVTKAGGSIYVCHSDTGGNLFRAKMIETGWLLKQCLIWVKDSFVLSRQDYHWQHEPILYGWKPGSAHKWYGRRVKTTVLDRNRDFRAMKKQELVEILQEIADLSTVIRVDRPRKNTEHPTMKPVQLVATLLANSTRKGDVVLDTFAGSGTTLIAATQMSRTTYSMEKDPRYADVIIERWQNLTGEKATREND